MAAPDRFKLFLMPGRLARDGLGEVSGWKTASCVSPPPRAKHRSRRPRAALAQARANSTLQCSIASSGPKGSESRRWRLATRRFFGRPLPLFTIAPFRVAHLGRCPQERVQRAAGTIQSLPTRTGNAYLRLSWGLDSPPAGRCGTARRQRRPPPGRNNCGAPKLISKASRPTTSSSAGKPLSKQPIGWTRHYDGVRMNIAALCRLPISPKNASKSTGKAPRQGTCAGQEGFPLVLGLGRGETRLRGVGDEPDGNRWNDCHTRTSSRRTRRRRMRPR